MDYTDLRGKDFKFRGMVAAWINYSPTQYRDIYLAFTGDINVAALRKARKVN